MMKPVNSEKLPLNPALPFSHSIVAGDYVFLSGQVGSGPDGKLVEGIQGQTEQVCKNLCAVLEAAGTSIEKVVKTTCFLSDMADFAAFNEVYGKYFVGKPARSCVAAKQLPKSVLCEVEVIAEI